MGVHYFYTWVTRRYPLFKKTYDPESLPSVDNFYLDLNGVLYKCARNDKALYRDILKSKNMDEIFADVFNYINKLVNTMRPRKRLIIAIDGVAPRAKMNNQRQRRYHSARSNKSLNEFLEDDLHTSPGVISFKNNSISPGTEFMFDLIDKIKFFVLRKIKEDDAWKKIEVIFSGGDTPGEGEHKIMEWLRGWKQSPEYDINESHVIYSNDADLIFLGLSLHIPKILILREVQNFDDTKVHSATVRAYEDTQLELLFINLLREYMDLEFRRDYVKFTHTFDIERIIDDFILIAFFIGNDFLHQLYCMSAKRGNFDEIIDIFKATLPTLGDYLSNKGVINWRNFSIFVKQIVKVENKMIRTTLDEMRDNLQETRRDKKLLFSKIDLEELDEDESKLPKLVMRRDNSGYEGEAEQENDYEDDKSPDAKDSPEVRRKQSSPSRTPTDGGLTLKQVSKNYELEMQLYYTKVKNEADFIESLLHAFESGDQKQISDKKLEFYQRFFGLKSLDEIDTVCDNYVKGIQFVMNYYFSGCSSWTWYYPYFISPFLSDFADSLERHADKINVTFDKAGPLRPYDQLAYILPRQSLGLLPQAYQDKLSSDPRSAKYYPENLDEFEPFDGVHDYQWIARLEPFDDKTMATVLNEIDTNKMSEVERNRNKKGSDYIIKYNPNAPVVHVKSIIKGLPDFDEHIETTPIDIAQYYPFEASKISHSQDGVDETDGFPSLKIIPGIEGYLHEVKKRGRYRRLSLRIYGAFTNRGPQPYSGFVFYDYPFKKVGFINAIIGSQGVTTCGNLPSEVLMSVVEEKRLKSPVDIYKGVEKDSLGDLYHQKGIDYIIEGIEETYYTLEYRKSAWRTAKSTHGPIIYEFEHVPDIYPQGLIFPFSVEESNQQDTQYKFPRYEAEIFRPGLPMVSLFNGDFLRISNEQPKDQINVYGDIIKPNNNLSKEVVTPQDLLEDQWIPVDGEMLKELGLQDNDVMLLYGLLDSFIIKTDQTKTSSLILGGMFDIGLRYFNALNNVESKLLLVIDLVKLSKCKVEPSQYVLPVRKFKSEYVYYDVLLSPKGKGMVKSFFEDFPEIITYLKKQKEKYGEKYQLPKFHDIRKIYQQASPDDDVNIKLFKVYQWIMVKDASSLELVSALSMNASAERMKVIIDQRMNETKRDKPLNKEVSIDRNMTIVHIPSQFTVGTSFRQHPSYPKLGHRVIYTNTQNPNIPFGRVGTVTGIYKSKIEIMFDEPFIGACNLNGRSHFFRGAVASLLEIFNLSAWKPFVNLKKDQLEVDGPQQVTEWDGKLDGFLLMDQIMQIKREVGDIDPDFKPPEGDRPPGDNKKNFSRRFVRRPDDGKSRNNKWGGGGRDKYQGKDKRQGRGGPDQGQARGPEQGQFQGEEQEHYLDDKEQDQYQGGNQNPGPRRDEMGEQ